MAGTATVEWQANPESDLKEYRVYHGTASRSYGASLPVGKATSYTFNSLADGVTHYFAVTAVDIDNNESGYSAEISKYVSVTDTQPPQLMIVSPTTSGSYQTTASSLTLSGTALDDMGVTQVSWYNSGGGSGLATGTASWSVKRIRLSSGQNTITVTGKDAAGNRGTAVITVNCKRR
jgi:fibronectin type 3 domain-containing protein